jgi:monoamine oxidase
MCKLPLPVMREIKFLPALRAPHIEAINEAAYARITQLHVEVKSRFWENTKSGSGEVHSPFLWSDTALERIFPQDRLADARPPTLTVWINGAGCASWDALSEEAANARVNAELEKIYPGARGAVRLAKKVSWHQEPFAGGAWINWAPGQITRFASALGQPDGRLFFAGEHTGTHFRGIEAAVSSGARAAKEIFATL